jgi:hypothetical protein
VGRLGKTLYDKKGKAKQIQPPQDNTTTGVNKPVEGETVICRICHKEGHKSRHEWIHAESIAKWVSEYFGPECPTHD